MTTSPADLPLQKVLVCDDEPVARRAIRRALGRTGYDLVECEDGNGALEMLRRDDHGVDLVLLDLQMPGMDGMTALHGIVETTAPPPVVVVTADTSIRSAIDAVKAGAADYLCRPYAVDELRIVVEKTLETGRLQIENRRLAAEVRRLGGGGELLGESSAMAEVLEAIERVALTSAGVLILGESGTGKELVARRIHRLSSRHGKPFVTVNCAAIPDTLVESELFGHRRGAFTGADRNRVGKFQEAHDGTIFLDEIGDMASPAQAKLLRVLEQGLVEPLGGGGPVEIDVRVVAATHRDLGALVADGVFREDLLFRLRVVDIPLPPLRDRGDDVLLLASVFLEAASAGRTLRLSEDCKHVLRAYRWPGNVRELANAIERAAIFCRGDVVRPEDLPADIRQSDAAGIDREHRPDDDFQTAKARVIEGFERAILTTALEEHDGNVSRAARSLGLHRQNVQQKLKKLGIDAASFRIR